MGNTWIRTDGYGAIVENKDLRAEKESFRGLWRKLKPADKPDEVRFVPLCFGSIHPQFLL